MTDRSIEKYQAILNHALSALKDVMAFTMYDPNKNKAGQGKWLTINGRAATIERIALLIAAVENPEAAAAVSNPFASIAPQPSVSHLVEYEEETDLIRAHEQLLAELETTRLERDKFETALLLERSIAPVIRAEADITTEEHAIDEAFGQALDGYYFARVADCMKARGFFARGWHARTAGPVRIAA